MSETADAVIVGAGIVGAACADALTREGLRVSVIESSVIGGGATAAGMGHIVLMDDSEAQFALTNYSRTLWNEIAPSLPGSIEYQKRGTLWIAADDEEMASVCSKQAYHSARGVAVQVLDAKALAAAEPNLRHGLVGALLVVDDSVINASCAAQYFVDQARRRGASVHEGVGAAQLSNDGVTLPDGTLISAALTICATGTHALEMFPGLKMRPRKGQLAITDRYPGFVHHQLVELGYLKSAHCHSNESVAFNVQPRSTGQVLIGSSRQYGETNPAIDRPLLNRMIERAVEYMPALAGLSIIRTWTGFRAATEDKLPLIGRWPGRERVYLATGHEGLGITTAVATARIITDLILARKPAIDPAPYLPARMHASTSL